MKTAIMNKLFYSFFAVIAGFFLVTGISHAASGSTGKEFYFAFQPNFNNGTLSLFITGQQDTQGTVDVAGLTFSAPFTVKANKVTTIVIPTAAQRLPVNAISKLAVHVVAQADVTVYGLNQLQYTTDAFLALPIDALGLEYYALSYQNNIGYPSQVVVVGAFNNTQVTITPSAQLNTHPAGVPFTITLNRGDTYMLTSSADVSGTNIAANAPVAVMSGVECVNIPTGAYYCDHIVEMMPPLSTWGKSFLAVPLATRLKGDVFRFLASENDTKININGTLVATLQRGKFFETVLKTRSEINASAPVLVAQYSAGTTFDGVTSDPFMMLIPPTEQFLNQYTFSTPATGFSANFVNVVTPTGDVANLQLDGAPVDGSKFSPIGTSGFSGAQLPITLGSHNLVSTSNVPLGIYVYGFASFDSYGYPGGMSFKAINPVGDPYLPNLRLTQMGDTIQGTATDSEDVNANGVLDTGEDLNGNAKIDRRSEDLNGNGKLDPGEDTNTNNILDRDTGIFKVELLPGSINLKLDVLSFVPGSLAVQFSITRIDLSKPGTGVLHIEDGAGNKIESPVAIGAVAVLQNVRVIETLSTADIEIDPASFKKQPFSITDGVNQKIIEWRFDAFNADATADLGFDIIFKKPIPGEKRLVSHKLDLFYTDVNGKPVHTELDSRFVDVHPANFLITPSVDKPSYVAGELVQITSVVKNLSTFNGSVGVRLSIKDAKDTLVSVLGALPNQAITTGGTVTFTGLNFPTGSTYVDNYKVVAELLDNNGGVVAVGYAPFAILAGSDPSVKASIVTDKQTYGPEETVLISDRLTNITANQALNDLRAITTVKNPDGTVRFTKTEIVLQLPLGLGNAKDFAYSLPLALAAAGQYSATLVVTSAQGTPLAQASTSFTVASSADTGAGLKGALQLSAKEVQDGEYLILKSIVTNLGNADLIDLPLTLSIVEPLSQTVMSQWPFTASIAQTKSFQSIQSWIVSGAGNSVYVALLTASVGGKTIFLAQESFKITIKLNLTQSLLRQGRVLVLLSCKAPSNDDDGDDKKAPARFKSGEDDDNDNDNKLCTNPRLKFVDDYLTAKNIPHLVTTTETAFKRAFRSGAYNVYWISGGAIKLHESLADELRIAVHHGDALLIDGMHDERNSLLDEVVGIKYEGKLSPKNPTMMVTGPIFAPGTLNPLGRALKLELEGGSQQASFLPVTKSDDGKPKQTPAIVTRNYGLGSGMIMAFDLIAQLQQNPIPASWDSLTSTALQYLTPPLPASYSAGAYVSLQSIIQNLAQTVEVDVLMQLPAGVSVVSTAPPATLLANGLSWRFTLPATLSQTLNLNLRLSDAANSSLTTNLNTISNGVVKPYGVYTLALPVTAALPGLPQRITSLIALNLTISKEREARDHAVKDLTAAQASIAAKQWEKAIDSLLEALEALDEINSVPMTDAIHHLEALLKEVQFKWWQAQ